MKRPADLILEQGGIEATRVFTRIWLALFGEWSWDDLPVMPPELIFLPSLVPAQRLRLGLLGAADDRAAHRRRSAPSRAAHRNLHRRLKTGGRWPGSARRSATSTRGP